MDVVESGPDARTVGDGEGEGDDTRHMDLVNDDVAANEHEYDGPMSIGDMITDTVDAMDDGVEAPSRAAVVGRVVGEYGAEKDAVEHAAEKLFEKGRLFEPAEDHWRVT